MGNARRHRVGSGSQQRGLWRPLTVGLAMALIAPGCAEGSSGEGATSGRAGGGGTGNSGATGNAGGSGNSGGAGNAGGSGNSGATGGNVGGSGNSGATGGNVGGSGNSGGAGATGAAGGCAEPPLGMDPSLVLPDLCGDPCTGYGYGTDCPSLEICRIAGPTEGRCEGCNPCGNLHAACSASSECDILFQCYAGQCRNFCDLDYPQMCGAPSACVNVGNDSFGVCNN